MADILVDIRDAYEYDTNAWKDIRDEAKTDMAFVGGDPWNQADKKQRKNRPTVAPEEMSQYFNQVINGLRANPRGMKFAPTGNGASQKGAEFYQAKAREIEYRSHALVAYLTAAENAIQRSYGYVRVNVRYASPRTRNQDLWIEAFPNPDMVLPDSDAIAPDSSDMKRCFVYQWSSLRDFQRDHPKAKVKNFSGLKSKYKSWFEGDGLLIAEYWCIKTRPRTLLLVKPPPPPVPPGQPVPTLPPIEIFQDELEAMSAQGQRGAQVVRTLREVDYPSVHMYLTNGVEILHEQNWLGKYIPIVSCYGKVLYTDGDQGMERKILSMTRFGRDPWKSYCYACSQELEILGMVPKAPFMLAKGQMDNKQLGEVQRSMHEPVAALFYNPTTEDTGPNILPKPERADYVQGQYLQSLEMVKEGWRRAIQAAMGSNFLPTNAQKINDKSGIALDKINQAAAAGTYHFVQSYEHLIRQVGVICADLIPKIYDYAGETGTMDAAGKAEMMPINDPNNPDSVSTQGDYLTTVSTAPSSDSEHEAVREFTDTLVENIQMIAAIAGPEASKAILALSIRKRNMGPEGDQLAELINPTPKDGEEPPSPELQQAHQQIQQMQQVLQQAAQEKEAKQVEQQGKLAIVQAQEASAQAMNQANNETKLAVAELGAKMERIALFLEERARLGLQVHERAMGAADAGHEALMAEQAHQQALTQGAQAGQQALQQGAQAGQQASAQSMQDHAQGLASQVQEAALQPAPTGAAA